MICIGCGYVLIPSFVQNTKKEKASTGYHCPKCKNKYDLYFHARIVEQYKCLNIEKHKV